MGRLPSHTPVTEPIFQALGPDKVAVEHALTSGNASDFVKDLLTNAWTDQGRSASALFRFAPGTATPTYPADWAQTANTYRMAHIMSTVGRIMSTPDSWDLVAKSPASTRRRVASTRC